MDPQAPTRPDEAGNEPPEDWKVFMQRVRAEADAAWRTGRRYYEASFIWSPPGARFETTDDAAGAIETIEAVGWRLQSVDHVNTGQIGQAGGILDSGPVRVRGFYLFRRPDTVE